MKQKIFGCLGVAAITFALQFTPADVQARFFSPCDPCNPCDQVTCDPCADAWGCDPCGAVNGCGPKAGKWFLGGHLEAGFFANGHGRTAKYDGPAYLHFVPGRTYGMDTGNTALLQNTRLTGGQLNQIYLSMGRSVDGRRGLDIGGTVDLTFGSDAYIVQARGVEFGAGHGGDVHEGRWGKGDYFSAVAQAYLELEYRRLNVKAGKFYAPFGMDSYKSTDNFFYSWSPTMYIAPTTAGGIYGTYKVNDRLSVLGGWIQPDQFGETSDDNAFFGGVVWNPGKRVSVSYMIAAGKNSYDRNELNVQLGIDKFEYCVHSFTTSVQLSKRLKYNLNWTHFSVDVPNNNMHSYALMNEIIYQRSARWAFGTRFGLLKFGEYGSGLVLNAADPDTEWYTVSLGANWTPNKWLTVKPEVRYDWMANPKAGLFNEQNNTYQVSGGMSAVVKF